MAQFYASHWFTTAIMQQNWFNVSCHKKGSDEYEVVAVDADPDTKVWFSVEGHQVFATLSWDVTGFADADQFDNCFFGYTSYDREEATGEAVNPIYASSDDF